MSLFALGLNHTTAPLDVRERVAFAPEALGDALRQ
jgi:glutamyl-tRNA reductase